MSIQESIRQSGRLFQSDPSIGNWTATRSVGPEIVAFKNESLDINRFSIRFFGRGETDEDGYTYTRNTWTLEIRGSFDNDELQAVCDELGIAIHDMIHSRKTAIDNAELLMKTLTDQYSN